MVRVILSTDPQLARPFYADAAQSETNHHDIVEFRPTHLKPDTQYHYALEINGKLDRKKAVQFCTFPPPASASFTIAFASCGKTAANNEVFDCIRENHPLFYWHRPEPLGRSARHFRWETGFGEDRGVTKYKGKLARDAIKGTIESKFGGTERKSDWNAKRVD